MKKIFYFSAICLMTSVVFAQPPQAIKYQAVVRDIDGAVVADKNVRVRISVLLDDHGGYLETYREEWTSLRSNNLGMLNFNIGRGNRLSSRRFDQIDWGAGSYFVQLEIDIDNTGYTNLGVTELLSVPYALYAHGSGGTTSIVYDLDDHVIPFYSDDAGVSGALVSSSMSQNADSNIVIGHNKTLRINNYIFPNEAGDPGKYLALNATGDSLIWVDGGSGGGGSGDADTNWLRTGENLRNRNTGDVIIGGDPTVPATESKGIYWINNEQAFRAGRSDNAEASSPLFNDAWNSSNIGANTIGMGTNVIAKGEGSFGLGRNLYIDNYVSEPGNFAIGKDSRVDGDNLFSIGINNDILSADNSFVVGEENVIYNAGAVSIVGGANEFTLTDYRDAFSIVAGHDNIIEDSEEFVFVFGTKNTVWRASDVLILGEENTLTGGDPHIYNNRMSIMVGKNNTIGLESLDNILVGSNNTSYDDDAIAIGNDLDASKSSIFIGRRNKSYDYGADYSTNNIVIGHDIDFAGDEATHALTNSVQNSIFIGNNFGRYGGSPNTFRNSHTIAIGNDISLFKTPMYGEGPHRSVNIGNNIETNIGNTIAIGQNISHSVRVDGTGQLRPHISIGNNIERNGTQWVPGYGLPGSSTRFSGGIITIGTPNMLISPFTPRGDSWTSAYPALIITPPTSPPVGVPPTNRPSFNLIYMDIASNLFIGARRSLQHGGVEFVRADSVPVLNSDGQASSTEFVETSDATAAGLRSGSFIFARGAILGATNIGPNQPGLLQLNSAGNKLDYYVGTATNNRPQGFPNSYITDSAAAILVVGNSNHRGGNIYVMGNGTTNSWGSGSAPNGWIQSPTHSNTTGYIFARGGMILTSDKKFKRNIKPLPSGMEDYLYKVRPHSYVWEDDETNSFQWGFMAQDVIPYFPHLVYEIGPMEGLGINYTGFIPVLWKINQDQQTEIDQQRMRIQNLERQINFINDYNSDELRRQQNRINELEKQLQLILEKLEQ
ncbi:MAG: tail fiber domain-containing protein [Bacteroidales bacterium]|nr:tail fiber domain-containing protein [Bacteroidales bacterium]